MALPNDLDFSIKYDLTNSPANFELADDTDYGTLGIALADVRGNYTSVTDPLGNVIHSNTDFDNPDVLPASSLLYTSLLIPTDAGGDIIAGQYSFTYDIKVDNPIIGVSQIGQTFTIDGDYVALIQAAGSIDVVRSTGNNGTYTVASVALVGGDTEITVVQAVPSGTADGSIQYSTQTIYSKTQTSTYSNVIPAISIEVQTDCFCGVLKSIDKTNYGTATIISRVHTVMYPAALQIADIVSSNATVTVSPIYTKTWTTKIESTISIPVTNGTIQATIVGSQETDVTCDLTLCEISCCVIALNNRYLDARCTNSTLAAKYFADLTRVMQLIEIFQMATACSQSDVASDALNEIKKVGNCQDTCRCDDDQPQIVVPLCSSGANCVNVTAGSGIVVNTTFANNCYTYQVALAPSILAIINSVKPQNILSGTGISVSYALVGGVDTWTITNTAPYTEQNRMEFQCAITFSVPGAPVCNIVNSDYLVSGSNINPTATVTNTTIGLANGKNLAATFKVSAFQVANNDNYKVTLEKSQLFTQGLLRPATISLITMQSGEFQFMVLDSNGFPITNDTLAGIPFDIILNIKISE